MLRVPLSRGWREPQALEQAHRAKILAFEYRGELAQLIALDKLGARQADHPVEPLLLAIRRPPRFELREPGAQPLERLRRLVLMLVDRRVAEDGEHLFRVRGGLRLQREAARPDDVHHFASRSCLAAFRSRMTH